MYFWKIEALKQDLVSGGISEKESFYYIWVSVLIYSLALEFGSYSPGPDTNVYDHLNSIFGVGIPMGGTLLAFLSNGGAGGRDFASRFFSIGFVVSLRFCPLLFVFFLAMLGVLVKYPPEHEALPTTWWEVLPLNLLVAALYWRMCHHISQVRKAVL